MLNPNPQPRLTAWLPESGTPLNTPRPPPFSHLSLQEKKGVEEFTGEKTGKKGAPSWVLGASPSPGVAGVAAGEDKHHRREQS